MPPRSFRRGRGTPPGHPAAPSSVPACGWAGPGLLDSHRPEPPGPSSSGTARGPPAGSGRGHRISSPGLPSCPSALCVVLGGVPRATGWHPQMAIPMVRTWWQRRSGFLPGFRHQCNKVRRKEGSGQGWLVKTQVCLFKTDKLTQVRTLRHPETSTLSFVSAITLCIRSDCFSLTARALESSLRLSPWTAVPRRLLSGLHANYYNQTQVILILHLTHLLTAVSWVFLPLQTSLNHAPLATVWFNDLSLMVCVPKTKRIFALCHPVCVYLSLCIDCV